ncbi:MAG: hypothetical protein KIT27_07705 [Legionellales bacterium]|nr:hypothetical protein [Legionellales bacterium]
MSTESNTTESTTISSSFALSTAGYLSTNLATATQNLQAVPNQIVPHPQLDKGFWNVMASKSMRIGGFVFQMVFAALAITEDWDAIEIALEEYRQENQTTKRKRQAILKLLFHGLRLVGNISLLIIGVATLIGISGYVLMHVLPAIVLAMVAINALYHFSCMCYHLWKAWKENDVKKHLKLALDHFLNALGYALMTVLFLNFFMPLLNKLKQLVPLDSIAGIFNDLSLLGDMIKLYSTEAKIIIITFLSTMSVLLLRELNFLKKEPKEYLTKKWETNKTLWKKSAKNPLYLLLAVPYTVIKMPCVLLAVVVALMAKGADSIAGKLKQGLFGNSSSADPSKQAGNEKSTQQAGSKPLSTR